MRLLDSLRLLAVLATGATSQDTTPFWMDSIAHNGVAAFNPDKSYVIFRNVKNYGAMGDGGECEAHRKYHHMYSIGLLLTILSRKVTDDTAAINLAISSGGRCGGPTNCVGSTTTPAVVFFPPGLEIQNTPCQQ